LYPNLQQKGRKWEGKRKYKSIWERLKKERRWESGIDRKGRGYEVV
jgi:hypothetical protein